MSIDKNNLMNKMDSSITKLEALGIPKHLLNKFARLKSLRKKIDLFDEVEDADVIKIISDKFTVLVNEITQEAIKSFNDFATTSVNDIKQATGGVRQRPAKTKTVSSESSGLRWESSGYRSSESSGVTRSSGESSWLRSSGESSGYRSSESSSRRTSGGESSSRRSSGESGGYRGGSSSSSWESGGYRWSISSG